MIKATISYSYRLISSSPSNRNAAIQNYIQMHVYVLQIGKGIRKIRYIKAKLSQSERCVARCDRRKDMGYGVVYSCCRFACVDRHGYKSGCERRRESGEKSRQVFVHL